MIVSMIMIYTRHQGDRFIQIVMSKKIAKLAEIAIIK